MVYEGGIPVFIDTEYDTWNMDPVALEKAFEIYSDVKVIVVAHLYGTPGKIDEIRELADKHNALIVEDAAESLGARYKSNYQPKKDANSSESAYAAQAAADSCSAAATFSSGICKYQ